MNKESFCFAFAVNHAGEFQPKHFGDADRYLVYEWQNNELVYLKELINIYKAFDEEQEHGSHKKGNAIIEYLKNEGVKVLVSKQFGRNIRMVNRHFIPVIIYKETPDEVIPVIKKNIKWIEDEFRKNPEEYKLFTFKSDVLKTIIKTNE
ncbi:MAG: hypothetical protein JXK95_16130 [Bacteroidales bacterium]|nr:hypothetical protein [Bacteroidales bacterium]